MSEATLHSVAGPRGIGDAAGLAARHPVLRPVRPPRGACLASRRSPRRGRARPSGRRCESRGACGSPARSRRGARVGEPDELASPRELLELSGPAALVGRIWRADPTLLTELQLGARTQAGTAHRFARRLPLPRRSLRRLRAPAPSERSGQARERRRRHGNGTSSTPPMPPSSTTGWPATGSRARNR